MFKKIWLVLNYTLPTEPSRHRVAAWRALKKMGAVNVQQSTWLLPDSEENYEQMEKLVREIEAGGGTAMLMGSRFFAQEQEEHVCDLFNEKRNEEYVEFIDECGKYLKEIEKEIRNRKFIYAELEEEEAELEKLLAWYEKIVSRDTLQASQGPAAKVQTELIQAAFDGYSELACRYGEKDVDDKTDNNDIIRKYDWDVFQ